MSYLDYAVLSLLAGIIFIAFSALWQMYVVLSESYTLDRYKNSPNMLWIAMAVFFQFQPGAVLFLPERPQKRHRLPHHRHAGRIGLRLGHVAENQSINTTRQETP